MIKVYTDGACSGNPGPGGYGVVIVYPDGNEKQLSGGDPRTTNNRMELTAVIKALGEIAGTSEPVEVYCDSQYIVKAFNENWLTKWISNDWKTSTRKPVENKDLWIELLKSMKTVKPKWNWVRGHSGNKYNEICDRLARSEIAGTPSVNSLDDLYSFIDSL